MPEIGQWKMKPTPATNNAHASRLLVTATSTHESQAINGVPYLTFRLGGQEYALAIPHVIEVAAMVERTRIAGAAPELLGIVNRHGTPMPLLDLRLILDQPAVPVSISTFFIVAQFRDKSVGLVVDEVLQVEYAAHWEAGATRYIEGIISQNGRLIQVVSLGTVLTAHLSGEHMPGEIEG